MSFNHAHVSKADAAVYSSSEDDDDAESDNNGLAHPSIDPRADEFLDFNPRKRRKTGRNTKESAALGIFGSDSDNDAPHQRWKSKADLRHKNVTFVSAGQEKLDQSLDEDEEEDESEYKDDVSGSRAGLGTQPGNTTGNRQEEQNETEEDDEDEVMTGMGLGFRASAQGLGFGQNHTSRSSSAPGNLDNMSDKRPNGMKTRYDGSNPLGTSFVPTSAKDPILKSDLSDDGLSAAQTPKPSAFGKGSGGSKAKSFAARMMSKMGYVEGQGLGANAQGRASIIEATLRPQGNVGLGTVREKSQQELKEEKRQARLRGEDVPDSDEERKKAKRERRKGGAGDSSSRSGVSTPKRVKPKYMTVSDIQKAAPGLHIPDAFAPILDMTGRDQKLLTSSSGLLTPTAGTELVEQTEARKLARRAQGDLAAFVEEWKTLEERKAWLDMEAVQRKQELSEFDSEFASLQVATVVLDELCQAARERQWDPLISGLKRVDTSSLTHIEELSNIAVAGIHPFLAQAVQGWQPLEDPGLSNFAADLTSIKTILGTPDTNAAGGIVSKRGYGEVDEKWHNHVKSTTAYESMIYKLVFPKLVTAISQTWDVHDPTPLLTVLDRWEQLFPLFVRSQLLDQVVRRLGDAIASWKPKKERTTLPHLWLFPWLQHLPPHHLDSKGTGLVSDVRRKFRQTIDTWHFDKGVVPGLKQWQDIFRPSKAQDQWKPLVMHHILPSMGRYLRANFRVDPSDQEPYLKILQGVVKWADIISSSMIAEVIVTEIFPMWHGVLHQWLISEEANYEEIGAWFEWWHNEVFPPEMAAQESIKAEFQRGTFMIEQALELGDEGRHRLPQPEKQPARPSSTKPHVKKPKPEEQTKRRTQPTEIAAEPTFRDEVESWCQENDLQFIPVRKANELGKHYFRLTARLDGKGGVLAYFSGESDNDVLVVESRKMNGVFRRADKAEWGALLATLFEAV